MFNEGGVNEVKTQRVERFGIEVMQKAILSVDVLSKERKPLEDFAAFLKPEDEKEPIRVVPAVREFLRFIAPSRSDVWGRRMMGDAEKLGPGTEFWQVRSRGLPLAPQGQHLRGHDREGRRKASPCAS